MRNKIGIACMTCGVVLVLAALVLFIYNRREAQQAEKSVETIGPKLVEYIQEKKNKDPDASGEPVYPDPYDPEMTEVEIDGYAYVGYISIPALGLELPVMSEWDYRRLKIAPCHYTGSTKTNDLVIAAHNYRSHFGRLSELSAGDEVLFVDMDGRVWNYTVAAVDVLSPFAVEEMTAGEYDLTLFTCTYGGANRVTVRCERSLE